MKLFRVIFREKTKTVLYCFLPEFITDPDCAVTSAEYFRIMFLFM